MTGPGDFKRYRAMKGADAAAMSPTRFAPYRKITGQEDREIGTSGYFHDVEVLECGHWLRPREDMIGRTYPERRRCVDCLRTTCAAAGHPLIDWFKRSTDIGIRPSFMRCKCATVTAGSS